MPAELAASPPPRVPDHELLGQIGSGSYGDVWLARNALGTPRAIKFVHRQKFDHARPFEREFSGIQQYEPISRQHAALVDVLQVGRDESDAWFYYVMELADCAPAGGKYVPQTLKALLGARGRLPVSEVAIIGTRIAEGLAFLHDRGLVHRDLKPSNIIFVDGAPKLADAGLVTHIGGEQSFVGTEGYIAPEGPGTPAADIYALGLVLYEAATGESRHDFPQLPAELATSAEAEHFSELNPVLLRACAPRASARFASAAHLADELRALAEGRSIRQLRELEARLRRLRRAGVLVATLAVLAGGAWYFQKRETAQAQELARKESAQRAVLAAKEHELRLNLYAADMSQAGEALRAGNLGRARDYLRAWLPTADGQDTRDAVWSYLAAQAAGDRHQVWRGHSRNVSGIALSPDGATAYSCGFDGTLRAWNVATGEGRVLGEKPGETFYEIARMPDGDFLLGGSSCLWRWRAVTGAWESLAKGTARSLAVSPDGRWAVFGGKSQFFGPDEPIEMVMLDDSGSAPVRFTDRTGRCAISPDGRWMATGEVDGKCALWATDGWTRTGSLECPSNVIALTFSPDSRLLAGALREGGVILWDTTTHRVLAKMEGHARQNVWCVDFSADGRWLATGGSDGTVHLWNTQDRRLERVLRGHEDEVWSARLSPDGRSLISSGKDETARLWPLDAPDSAPLPDRIARRAIYSGDSRWIAASEKNGPVRIFAADTLAPAVTLGSGHVPLAFSDFNETLVTTDLSRIVHWRWRDSTVLLEVSLESAGNAAVHLALSPDGRWLAAALADGRLVIWSAETGRIAHRAPTEEGAAFCVAFSPDGRWLASSHHDFSMRVRAAGEWSIRHTWRHHKMRAANLTFSPNSEQLLSASWDGTGALHNLVTGRLDFTFRGHTSSLQDAAFLGRELIVALEGDASLAFWDLRTGRTSGRLRPALDESNHCLTPAPDGHSLIATRLSGSRPGIWRAIYSVEKPR